MVMRKIGTMLLAALIAGTAGQSIAKLPGNGEANLRCVVIFGVAAGQVETSQQANLILGMMYFIGRLDQLAPDMDFETELRRTFANLPQSEVASEGQRCNEIFVSRGNKQLQAVGKALKKKP